MQKSVVDCFVSTACDFDITVAELQTECGLTNQRHLRYNQGRLTERDQLN